MIYFLYFSVIVFSVIQSASVKYYNRTSDNTTAFNTMKSLSALLLFGAVSICSFRFHTASALYGGIYGMFLCISMYSGYKALCIGPMSLTSLIISFSVILPLFYGIKFCGESLNAFKCAGLVFLSVAIIFANTNKKTNRTDNYMKWTLYTAATFICNGICSILQKMHQIKYPGEYCSEFMLFAMLVCSVIFTAISIKNIPSKKYICIKGKRYAVLSGIANAVANYSAIALAGSENASVLYPAISAGTILGTLICGTVMFKEKLRFSQLIALISGITAIVLLKL